MATFSTLAAARAYAMAAGGSCPSVKSDYDEIADAIADEGSAGDVSLVAYYNKWITETDALCRQKATTTPAAVVGRPPWWLWAAVIYAGAYALGRALSGR